MNRFRGYVDAMETLNERVDVSPSWSVGQDEMVYGTPPTSPSYADVQDDKAQSSQFVLSSTNDVNNTKK